MTCTEYLGAINLILGWFSNKRKFYHAVKQSLFYSMVKFPFIGECYNIICPTSRWRLRYISWYIQGLCSQLSESWHLGEGGGGQNSNNPDHKVGMLAQSILKMPSSISLGVLELQSPNILTYLMNVSCMDDMKKVYCPLYLVVNYALTPTSPMHGETSHVQVKDPVV